MNSVTPSFQYPDGKVGGQSNHTSWLRKSLKVLNSLKEVQSAQVVHWETGGPLCRHQEPPSMRQTNILGFGAFSFIL